MLVAHMFNIYCFLCNARNVGVNIDQVAIKRTTSGISSSNQKKILGDPILSIVQSMNECCDAIRVCKYKAGLEEARLATRTATRTSMQTFKLVS